MNILYIENAGNRNAGAFRSLIAMIVLLRKYGINGFVAIPDRADGIDLLEKNEIPYITLRECSYTWMLKKNSSIIEVIKMPLKNVAVYRGAKQLVEYIKKNDIQIVHENTSACYIGYYAAKDAKVAHVWHIREFMEEDFNARIWWKNRAIKWMNNADAVIAISNAIERKYRAQLNGKNLIKIYNGIVVDQFYDNKKRILEDSSVSILCVGRVGEGKGQKNLINAIGILKSKYHIEPKVYFAGSYTSEIYNTYVDYAKRCGVINQVSFLGQVEDMTALYKKADIFCMCSKCEAFGRVTVEAMLTGNLVVGGMSGGTPEILENGRYGFLYNPGDDADLAEKLAEAIKNPTKSQQMAIDGREHVKITFDADINAKNVYELYKNIMMKGVRS